YKQYDYNKRDNHVGNRNVYEKRDNHDGKRYESSKRDNYDRKKYEKSERDFKEIKYKKEVSYRDNHNETNYKNRNVEPLKKRRSYSN
ncbi:MAG: hypothetical protein Q8S44_06645, partial [Flavobacteriaceae bacterium]|nr:hypothetical protein [Flavobacteriaceae bacterium]